jgi:hypothetical protein
MTLEMGVRLSVRFRAKSDKKEQEPAIQTGGTVL